MGAEFTGVGDTDTAYDLNSTTTIVDLSSFSAGSGGLTCNLPSISFFVHPNQIAGFPSADLSSGFVGFLADSGSLSTYDGVFDLASTPMTFFTSAATGTVNTDRRAAHVAKVGKNVMAERTPVTDERPAQAARIAGVTARTHRERTAGDPTVERRRCLAATGGRFRVPRPVSRIDPNCKKSSLRPSLMKLKGLLLGRHGRRNTRGITMAKVRPLLVAGVLIGAVSTTSPALARARTQSGTANGISWTAASTVVGATSTGTGTTDPRYLARNSDGYSGTVGIIMTYSNGAQSVCSGSLLNDRRSIATAAHCVSDGAANDVNGRASGLVSTQVVFLTDAASNADTSYYAINSSGMAVPAAGTVGVAVDRYFVNSGYTGEVIDQNDIAVLRLSQAAPAFAQSYALYDGDLTGEIFNVASFGTRSLVGGAEGTTGPGAGAGPNRRRQGDNIYDYAWGDASFNGLFTNPDVEGCGGTGTNWFCGDAQIEFSYISDFDRYRGNTPIAINSMSCIVAAQFANSTAGCGAGYGLADGRDEVSIAGGDSGGAAFVGGKLASINSYGLTFGIDYGDFKDGLNSSWGELNGFVPVSIHTAFIQAAMVPEPATWALMILGFGAVGGAMRRKQATKATVRLA